MDITQLEGRKVKAQTRNGSTVEIRIASVDVENDLGFYVYGYRTKLRNAMTGLRAGRPQRYYVPKQWL